MNSRLLAIGIIVLALPVQAANNADFKHPSKLEPFMDSYCFTCHDDETQKGDIRLDNLSELKGSKRLDMLNRLQEQLFFKHMPPKKKKAQPSEAERAAILKTIANELDLHNASTLEGKLQKPEYANFVDHDKLFSGEYAQVPGFTYDRRWLVSEFIFTDKFSRMLKAEATATYADKKVAVYGAKRMHRGFTPTNPFLLPTRSGVRYYADTDLTGGHLSTMLTNAQKAAGFITSYMVPRYKKNRDPYLPAIAEIMSLEDQHNTTLASRREFLEAHIERVCTEIYGDENMALLPNFVAVELEPLKELAEGEVYKKAPMNVSTRMLEKLGAAPLVYNTLIAPEHADLTDDQFRAFCERIWFYRGDHERTIQSRMALLREYVPEFREIAEKNVKRHKMAEYKPLTDEEMTIVRKMIREQRQKGNHYLPLIEKCMTQWEAKFQQERVDAGPPPDELFAQLTEQLFMQILERNPAPDEAAEYLALAKGYQQKLGNLKAIQKLIQTVILASEFVYRQEFGTGDADQHDRRMLSPRDASYAIAYALTDQSPDEELAKAAAEGRLNTREDYKREIERMLARRDLYYYVDPDLTDRNWRYNVTNQPIRKLRFFREFFGYQKALKIFKDEKRFGGDRLDQATNRVVSEADQLIEYILEKDEKVFETILGTEEFFVFHDGDNERMQELSESIKTIYAYFKDKDWENWDYEELGKHKEFLRVNKMRSINPDKLKSGNRSGDGLTLFKKSMRSITARLDKGQKDAAPFDLYRGYGSDYMPGENVAKLWGFSKSDWPWSAVQPAKVPNRKGILTHPAWLIAHAHNTETDPVVRGKFIREKLLAGTIPDVPITVDAVIPEDHNATLRDRLAGATETSYCWKCHELMNPLGYVFESFDDFGRFRLKEYLEYPDKLIKKNPDKAPKRNHLMDLRDIYKTLPVKSTGALAGTGDDKLDGELKNAIELSDRLVKSTRVRQSIIRHAFRYFMGRNEQLSDSKTLMNADKAYVESDGSFDALIISLLTSDSFIYRKAVSAEQTQASIIGDQ